MVLLINRFGAFSGLLWDFIEIVSGLFRDYFGTCQRLFFDFIEILLGLFWDYFGTFWDYYSNFQRSFWDFFETIQGFLEIFETLLILRLIWDVFMTFLGLLWYFLKITLGLFHNHFRNFFGLLLDFQRSFQDCIAIIFRTL